MERKKEDRSMLMLILLSAVTCGIYGVIFYWKLYKDLNDVCRAREMDDSQKSPNYLVFCLFTIFSCGLYAFYWEYKQGNRVQRAGESYGVRIDENGTTLLLWSILGAFICALGPIVAQYLMIKNINTLCKCYNQEYTQRDGGYGPGYAGGQNVAQGAGYDQNAGYSQNTGDSYAYNSEDTHKPDNSYVDMENDTVGIMPGMLVCKKGDLTGAQIPIHDREVILVGRDSSVCNLVLGDMDISRRHCLIQFSAAENCYFVTDYSSTGVRISGTRPLEKNALTKCSRGTRIVLGNGSNEFLLK